MHDEMVTRVTLLRSVAWMRSTLCVFSVLFLDNLRLKRVSTTHGSMSLRPMKCDIFFPFAVKRAKISGSWSARKFHFSVSKQRFHKRTNIWGFHVHAEKAPKQKWEISFLGIRFSSVRFFFCCSFRCSMQSAILLAQLFDLCRDLRRYSNESQFNGEMEMAWMNAQNVSSFSIGFVFAGASNKRNATKPQWLKEEKYTREFLKCKKKFAC